MYLKICFILFALTNISLGADDHNLSDDKVKEIIAAQLLKIGLDQILQGKSEIGIEYIQDVSDEYDCPKAHSIIAVDYYNKGIYDMAFIYAVEALAPELALNETTHQTNATIVFQQSTIRCPASKALETSLELMDEQNYHFALILLTLADHKKSDLSVEQRDSLEKAIIKTENRKFEAYLTASL